MAVELKVNVINQLKLLRQSTFKDIYCFLDEDVQNAQRAKATEVRVTVDRWGEGTVSIENNGNILTNPQALFSIAESDWDEEVRNSENPFGMGFFSNITVSNLINVHSGNTYITFDVEDMISTNNTEIKVEEIDEYYDGFKLILRNFDFDTASSYDIQERVEVLGKYIHELDIYYNGELIEEKDLTEGDGSKYQFSIDDENCKGWIALGNNYSWGNNVNVFYKGRLVTPLEGLPYLKGDLHVSDKTLNLTSPDRKDIIKDEKLNVFKKVITEHVKKYCTSLLVNGEENISDYASCFGYYVNKKNVKNSIKFMTFKSKSEDDIKYLKGIAIARGKNKDIKSFTGYEIYLKKDAAKQNEQIVNEVTVNPELQTAPEEANGRIYHEASYSHRDGYVEVPEIKIKDLMEKRGSLIIDPSEPTFYIGFSEVEQYEYKLNIARHYDLKIIVSRNEVETSILKSMKESDNVLHISELKEEITVRGYLSNTELSIKESRALMIFDMISRILGFDHNVFAIGDLMVTKSVSVESIGVEEEMVEPNIVVLKDELNDKVYVDRSIINKNKLRNDTDANLDIFDYQFILANFKEMMKQVALVAGISTNDCEVKVLDILGNCA